MSQQAKIWRVLDALVNGWSGHRFQAESALNDHSLHSTVSTLQNKYKIRIDRKSVIVAGFRGAKTRVMKYWLSDDQLEKAKALLALQTKNKPRK